MTKHLRLIMLSLFAMICMGGYSLPKSVVYTFAKEPTLVSGKNIVSKWDIPTSGITDSNGRGYGWYKPSKAVTATLSADSKVRVTSIVINANTNDGTTTVAIAVGNNAIAAQTIQKSGTKGDTNKNYTYTNTSKEESTDIKFTLKSNKSVWIKTITINYEESDGRTPTTLSFPGLTGEGVTLIDGKLANGDDFNGYTAAVTPVDATGSIEYNSSDEAIAKVNAATGAITLGAKYGTAVITAKFVATGNYANSEARYSIKHLEDFVFYESFDKCNGEGGIDGIENSWSGNLSGDALSDKATDNPDWTFVNGRERNQCASFGASDKGGSATSPNIQIDQKAQLKFKAACWNTKAENSQITISVSNGTLTYNGKNSQSVTIDMVKGAWTDYSMIVSGTNSFTVTFAGSDTKNRFFLDEVMVTKVAPQEITLDENSDNIVEAAENVNVTLKRKLIADDNWNTLCIPFNLTPEQTTKAFGADVELRTLTHAEGTTLTFGKATEIKAGKPYLIRVKEVPADNVYKFTGVKVIAAKDNWTIQDVGNVHFIGLYAPQDVTEFEKLLNGGVALFLGDNNKFFRAQSGTKMGGFRAFFLVSIDTNPTNVKAVIDGVANGIEDLVIDGVKANGRVYNLNGQYVGKSLNGLQPGLYIQNGKKIVVK